MLFLQFYDRVIAYFISCVISALSAESKQQATQKQLVASPTPAQHREDFNRNEITARMTSNTTGASALNILLSK